MPSTFPSSSRTFWNWASSSAKIVTSRVLYSLPYRTSLMSPRDPPALPIGGRELSEVAGLVEDHHPEGHDDLIDALFHLHGKMIIFSIRLCQSRTRTPPGNTGMGKIRIAIAGVGNCCSALLQGIEFYRDGGPEPRDGLHPGADEPGHRRVPPRRHRGRRRVRRRPPEGRPPRPRGDLLPPELHEAVRREHAARRPDRPDGPHPRRHRPPHGRLSRRPDVPAFRGGAVRRGAGPARVRRRDPGELPAGGIGGGDAALRGGVPPHRGEPRQLHPRVHRLRPGVGRPLPRAPGSPSWATT